MYWGVFQLITAGLIWFNELKVMLYEESRKVSRQNLDTQNHLFRVSFQVASVYKVIKAIKSKLS
jgi:hypothetical protein